MSRPSASVVARLALGAANRLPGLTATKLESREALAAAVCKYRGSVIGAARCDVSSRGLEHVSVVCLASCPSTGLRERASTLWRTARLRQSAWADYVFGAERLFKDREIVLVAPPTADAAYLEHAAVLTGQQPFVCVADAGAVRALADYAGANVLDLHESTSETEIDDAEAARRACADVEALNVFRFEDDQPLCHVVAGTATHDAVAVAGDARDAAVEALNAAVRAAAALEDDSEEATEARLSSQVLGDLLATPENAALVEAAEFYHCHIRGAFFPVHAALEATTLAPH